ncbi:SWI/SNF-related matrix-associated actin-dependent regulator of chromatin subfamily A member 5-like, partial [Sitodiplosis mosellana]|uniref:SWI/SNF-related matrix-associated actin-dependent regulator of chromatin subfamily A member 5-like n=1 Tax=Sitodiplosis mosellana TaxID=263140 RepID=UPI00244402AE
MCENGNNGILGDEMGLGKTIQTISIFGYMKNVKKINGPFLVAAPLSTLQNWLNESQTFCPSLRTFVLHAYKDERAKLLEKLKKPEDWDPCITSYDFLLKEYHKFRKPNWQYVVLDEGHKIKNEKTKMNGALKAIESKHRLMLTGTPLQNNLHELWALLNYLLPNVFADSVDFDSDDGLSGNETIVNPQIQTYGKVQANERNNIFVELRKAANHPYLIDNIEPSPPYTTDQHLVDSCGKMKVLDQLLAQLKAQGSRVVLFSQAIRVMLEIIEDYLMWRGYKCCRLDGNNTYDERTKSIDEFNAKNSEKFVFILSTRAGGL